MRTLKLPLPPRRLVKADNVEGEPYYSQMTYKWSDPITDRLANFMERSVKMQRKLMAKAGVNDPRKCNQVEMELRLGQLTTRKSNYNEKHETGGGGEADAKKEGGQGGVHRGGKQNRVSESLLRLPVATPTLIDEQMSSFHNGFKINGRCDTFFTVPVRAKDSDNHFVEVRNRFTDQRVFEWEIERMSSLTALKKAYNEDETQTPIPPQYKGSSKHVSDEEKAWIYKNHRWQSSIEAEGHLSEEERGKQGFVEGCFSKVCLGEVDPHGSDQLPRAPMTWLRKTKLHSAATSDGALEMYESTLDNGISFELHALTNDGYRVQYTDGAVASTGAKVEKQKVLKDKIMIEALKTGKERKQKIADFAKKLQPGEVRSAYKQTDNGFHDINFDTKFVMGDHETDSDSYMFASQVLAFPNINLTSKASIAQSNFRMPTWCADVRMSVAIERTSNDDNTPFDINAKEIFAKDHERSFSAESLAEVPEGSKERAYLEQRLNREITILRFSKRMEYRLLLAEDDLDISRSYRLAAVRKWFNLPETKGHVLDLALRGTQESTTFSFDPIADQFLKLSISDIYSSQDPGHVKGLRTELLAFADIRHSQDLGYLVTRPNGNDHRFREVEVEVNLPAVVDAVVAHEARLEANIQSVRQDATLSASEQNDKIRRFEREAAFQVSELYNVISFRMLDALGSFSKLP